MSGSPQLGHLSPELLGKIFGYTTVPDILGLKSVNRTFYDVILHHPQLQYKCELAAAGLSDNPDAPGAFFDRRTNLHKYRSRFDNLKPARKSRLLLGPTGRACAYDTSGDIYAMLNSSTQTLHFYRLPSTLGNRPMKTWSVTLPFNTRSFKIYPPLDLVVLNMSSRLHILSMTTGDPHPLAANRWIEHDLVPAYAEFGATWTMAVSDRIVSARVMNQLVQWDWRTGAKIFDYRDLKAGSMAFIGKDHLLATEDIGPRVEEEVPTVILLETSILADSPAVSRQVRFVCDPCCRGMRVRVMAEGAGYSDFCGVMGQEVPFFPDPSQRVLALLFLSERGEIWSICVVRSETLLRLAKETREGVVEWNTWKNFTVSPDPAELRGANSAEYSVSGSRFVRIDTSNAGKWARIRVYDLSHWSRQYLDAEPEGEMDGKKVRYRFSEGAWKLPENTRRISHARVVQNGIVFFSYDSWRSGMDIHIQAPGVLDIWSF